MKSSASRTLVFLALLIIGVSVLVFSVSEEVSEQKPVPAKQISAIHYENRININTADKETLMQLNGIGEVRAQQIIDFRTKNGQFVTTQDLMRIDGIGLALFEKIKNDITV